MGLSLTAREVLQILAQGLAAYGQNPTLDSYKAAVLRMDGTFLRLTTAIVPRLYIEELYQGKKTLSHSLQLSQSKPYNLRECRGRRGALRLLLGFLNSVQAKVALLEDDSQLV